MVISHLIGHKGAGTSHIPGLVYAIGAVIHINDGPIGVAEVVGQRRVGGVASDGHRLALGFDGGNVQIAGGTVMDRNQMVQTFLNGLTVHIPATGKGDAVTQGDG